MKITSKKLHFLVIIILSTFIVACRNSSRDEDLMFDDTWEEGEEMEEEPFDGAPVIPKEAGPTQEELIKKHKVKLCREEYDDGGYNISHYDEDGNLSKTEYFDGEKLSTTIYSYEFDDDGNTTKKVLEEDDGTISFEWTYDEHGRELTYLYTYHDGDQSTTTFSYDDEERTKTEEDEYGSYVYYYTKDGILDKMESYDVNGKLESVVDAILDENGNKIREESEVMGIEVIDDMTYNERGQLLRKDRGGMVTVSMVFEYDEKGLTIHFERIGGTLPSTTIYTYEYY